MIADQKKLFPIGIDAEQCDGRWCIGWEEMGRVKASHFASYLRIMFKVLEKVTRSIFETRTIADAPWLEVHVFSREQIVKKTFSSPAVLLTCRVDGKDILIIIRAARALAVFWQWEIPAMSKILGSYSKLRSFHRLLVFCSANFCQGRSQFRLLKVAAAAVSGNQEPSTIQFGVKVKQ